MSVLAITVNFRTPELALRAARAELVALEGLDASVVIVDNDSADGSFERLVAGVQALQDARVSVVASGRNGGFGYGNNVAIRRALASANPPDFIHLFNPDSIPSPACVRALCDAMANDPKIGIAGGRIEGLDGSRHQSAFQFPSWLSELDLGLGLGVFSRLVEQVRPNFEHLTESQPVDWVSGCSLMLRASMLASVGDFDEGYFLYFEEVDLCRRAREAGFLVGYVHESVVQHVGGASTGVYDRDRPLPSYWYESRERYLRKHHGGPYFFAVTVALATAWAGSTVRYAIQHKPPRHPPRFARDLLREAFGKG